MPAVLPLPILKVNRLSNLLLQSFLFCFAEIFARWNMQEKEMPAAQSLPFLKWNRLANPLLQSFLFCCAEIFARWNMHEKEMPASQSLPFLLQQSDSQIRSSRALVFASQKHLIVATCTKRKCLLRSRSLFFCLFHYIMNLQHQRACFLLQNS